MLAEIHTALASSPNHSSKPLGNFTIAMSLFPEVLVKPIENPKSREAINDRHEFPLNRFGYVANDLIWEFLDIGPEGLNFLEQFRVPYLGIIVSAFTLLFPRPAHRIPRAQLRSGSVA